MTKADSRSNLNGSARIWLAAAMAALLVLGALALTGCGAKQATTDTNTQSESTAPKEQAQTQEQANPEDGANAAATDQEAPKAEDVTELKIEDLKKGTGAEAKAGATVSVHYTGWLTDGTKFDPAVDRGTPFEFPLGAGNVIAGWDQGVEGMKVGGKRRLTIPPDLGYGAQGAGGAIPPNATLVFDVELLDVK